MVTLRSSSCSDAAVVPAVWLLLLLLLCVVACTVSDDITSSVAETTMLHALHPPIPSDEYEVFVLQVSYRFQNCKIFSEHRTIEETIRHTISPLHPFFYNLALTEDTCVGLVLFCVKISDVCVPSNFVMSDHAGNFISRKWDVG